MKKIKTILIAIVMILAITITNAQVFTFDANIEEPDYTQQAIPIIHEMRENGTAIVNGIEMDYEGFYYGLYIKNLNDSDWRKYPGYRVEENPNHKRWNQEPIVEAEPIPGTDDGCQHIWHDGYYERVLVPGHWGWHTVSRWVDGYWDGHLENNRVWIPGHYEEHNVYGWIGDDYTNVWHPGHYETVCPLTTE